MSESHLPGCCCRECSRNLTGNKYTNKLSTTEISKKVREEIKEAKKKGVIPKSAKISVTTSYFAGGSSIDITVRELPFNPLNSKRVLWEKENPHQYIGDAPPRMSGFLCREIQEN